MTAVDRLRFIAQTLPAVLGRYSDTDAGQRPAPDRWCRKEVLPA